MKLRYVKGISYIQLPRAYIKVLNIRRNDKFETILRRDTYENGGSKKQCLYLIAHLIRASPYDTSPLKRVAQINCTKWMDLFRWVPGQRMDLVADENNTPHNIKLIFDAPVTTYGIPDYHNLTEKDLRKHINKYKDKLEKLQIQSEGIDASILEQAEHPGVMQSEDEGNGINPDWGDLSKDLDLKNPDFKGE